MNRALFALLCVGATPLLAGEAPASLRIRRADDAAAFAKLSCEAPAGAYCRLYHSDDLVLWTVQETAIASESGVTFPILSQDADRAFFRVAVVPVQPLEWMAWIEPGEFMISSPPDEVGRFLDKEDPQTRVRLTRGYWLSRFEVTQGEFLAVLGFNPSLFKGELQRPVEDVTWFEAVRFCTALTDRERKEGRIPPGFEYRLPTEAEWAYAARAGTTTRFSYGDDPGYQQLRNYAWYSGNSGLRPHPVGQKLPNPWGLYDMHGNVFEWCSDWYAPLPGGTVIDPPGATTGTDRIIRGGYWDSTPDFCRSAVRVHFIPSTRISYLGFRVALAETPPP